MVEAETHTREELEGMSRLLLRRICKGRGMSSEECSKMEFDDMVAWIDDNQEGGGRSRKAAPKSSSKAAPKGGKKAPPKGSGKKAPPKSPPKGRTKAKVFFHNCSFNCLLNTSNYYTNIKLYH